jgi:hypothetical protein
MHYVEVAPRFSRSRILPHEVLLYPRSQRITTVVVMAGSRALLKQAVLLFSTLLACKADTTVHVVFGNHLVRMHTSYSCAVVASAGPAPVVRRLLSACTSTLNYCFIHMLR